jgi:hypothetical protein
MVLKAPTPAESDQSEIAKYFDRTGFYETEFGPIPVLVRTGPTLLTC